MVCGGSIIVARERRQRGRVTKWLFLIHNIVMKGGSRIIRRGSYCWCEMRCAGLWNERVKMLMVQGIVGEIMSESAWGEYCMTLAMEPLVLMVVVVEPIVNVCSASPMASKLPGVW